MRFAASSNEMFHLLLFAIGSNEFVLVAHDLVSGAVTANRHSHGDCQHPACIMLLGYHWADVLPPAAPYRAPTTLLPQTACRCITGRRTIEMLAAQHAKPNAQEPKRLQASTIVPIYPSDPASIAADARSDRGRASRRQVNGIRAVPQSLPRQATAHALHAEASATHAMWHGGGVCGKPVCILLGTAPMRARPGASKNVQKTW